MDVTIKTKIKELLNHGLVYGLTSSLQSILGFVLLPILTVYYTPEEYGIYSIILLVSALAGALFYFGASSALARFYFDEDSVSYRKKIASSALFVTLFGALFLISLSIIFGKYLSVLLFNASIYYLHIILACSGAAFVFLLNIMTLLLRYQKQSILFLKITLFGVILNFMITYVLLSAFSYGILAPLYGTLLSSMLCFFLILWNNFSEFTIKIQSSYISKILNFGLKSSLAGFLFYLLDYIDRLILKELVPMSDVGIYSLGAKIATLISVILIVPFSLVWAPMRMEYASNNNNKEFTVKVFSYLSILGFILISISILFAEDLMSFVFVNNEFSDAAKVFPVIMLALLIFGFQNIVDYGIYLHEKVYVYIIVALIGIAFNVSTNYLFIPYFGYLASAYTTLFTYLLTTLIILIVSSYYHQIKYEWYRIIIPFIILVTIQFLNEFVDIPYLITFSQKIFITFTLLLFIIFFWLDKNEKAAFMKFYNNKINKKNNLTIL